MPASLVILLGGFGIGLLGSLHCIGMCGPIALAIPIGGKVGMSRWTNIIAYNIGRATTYSLLGAMMGIVGHSFSLFGWQQIISVASGIFIILLLIKSKWSGYTIPFLDKIFFSTIKKAMQSFLSPGTGISGRFLLGMLNGLLPCGLVYIALASALSLSSMTLSAMYMFLFGIGTLPAMFSISFFQQPVLSFLKGKGKYIINTFVLFMAVLLIVRGLGLGIPYISPKINVSQEQTSVDCCHKK